MLVVTKCTHFTLVYNNHFSYNSYTTSTQYENVAPTVHRRWHQMWLDTIIHHCSVLNELTPTHFLNKTALYWSLQVFVNHISVSLPVAIDLTAFAKLLTSLRKMLQMYPYSHIYIYIKSSKKSINKWIPPLMSSHILIFHRESS